MHNFYKKIKKVVQIVACYELQNIGKALFFGSKSIGKELISRQKSIGKALFFGSKSIGKTHIFTYNIIGKTRNQGVLNYV